jgi:hypothetical protein
MAAMQDKNSQFARQLIGSRVLQRGIYHPLLKSTILDLILYGPTVAGFVGRLPGLLLAVILSEAKNPGRQLQADNRMDSSLRSE